MPTSINRMEKKKKTQWTSPPSPSMGSPSHPHAAVARCPRCARTAAERAPAVAQVELDPSPWSPICRGSATIDLDPPPERPPRSGVGQGRRRAGSTAHGDEWRRICGGGGASAVGKRGRSNGYLEHRGAAPCCQAYTAVAARARPRCGHRTSALPPDPRSPGLG